MIDLPWSSTVYGRWDWQRGQARIYSQKEWPRLWGRGGRTCFVEKKPFRERSLRWAERGSEQRSEPSASGQLLQEVHCCCLVAQLCSTLCNAMDCSLPDSSLRGILQTKILEWVAMPSSRGSSWPRDLNPHLLHCRQILYHCATGEAPQEVCRQLVFIA